MAISAYVSNARFFVSRSARSSLLGILGRHLAAEAELPPFPRLLTQISCMHLHDAVFFEFDGITKTHLGGLYEIGAIEPRGKKGFPERLKENTASPDPTRIPDFPVKTFDQLINRICFEAFFESIFIRHELALFLP
jgi:hypothetical protein